MEDMICNANVYSAFLEGKATKDEMRTILKKMMRDSRLMMKLNLAATVTSKRKKMTVLCSSIALLDLIRCD